MTLYIFISRHKEDKLSPYERHDSHPDLGLCSHSCAKVIYTLLQGFFLSLNFSENNKWKAFTSPHFDTGNLIFDT